MSGAVPDHPTLPPGTTPARPLSAWREAAARNMMAPSRKRRPPTSGQLARRRWLVRGAKWLLPSLALALLATVAFWPEIEGNPDASRVSFRRVAQPRPEALRVLEPHYQGVDELNRPYTITARAAQQRGAEEILDLEEPKADILLSNGAWVYLRADAGRYDRPARRLDLSGAVTIYHDNGTMMRTDSARVLLKEGSASGDAAVAAQGPFGTLTSQGFRLTERGARVVFTGQAHAVLENRR